jgi:hypothetical protein
MRRRIEVSVYQAHKYERVGASQPSVERRSAVAFNPAIGRGSTFLLAAPLPL